MKNNLLNYKADFCVFNRIFIDWCKYSELLNIMMPKFDENKSKITILIEIYYK